MFDLTAMMRVGILEAGYELETAKPDFVGSDIDPDRTTTGERVPSAAERMEQTQMNSQGPRPKAPMGQPQAAQADRFTLSVPPSERLRVSVTAPPLRPGREARKGELKGSTRAEVGGEVAEVTGEAR